MSVCSRLYDLVVGAMFRLGCVENPFSRQFEAFAVTSSYAVYYSPLKGVEKSS